MNEVHRRDIVDDNETHDHEAAFQNSEHDEEFTEDALHFGEKSRDDSDNT
jgi:hypothetical protein